MDGKYIHFQVALDGSYFGKSLRDPFSLAWRSDNKSVKKVVALEEVVWNCPQAYIPGYIFSYDNGINPYERLVSFPSLAQSDVEDAKFISRGLVQDALNYHEGYIQELGGAKQFR